MSYFDEYHLTATPAVVIEEMIKIIGFCPSKETLVRALRESGLEYMEKLLLLS